MNIVSKNVSESFAIIGVESPVKTEVSEIVAVNVNVRAVVHNEVKVLSAVVPECPESDQNDGVNGRPSFTIDEVR